MFHFLPCGEFILLVAGNLELRMVDSFDDTKWFLKQWSKLDLYLNNKFYSNSFEVFSEKILGDNLIILLHVLDYSYGMTFNTYN